MGHAVLVCDRISQTVIHDNQWFLDDHWRPHAAILIALPTNIDVFTAIIAQVKCPCGSEMVISTNPQVCKETLARMGVSYGTSF